MRQTVVILAVLGALWASAGAQPARDRAGEELAAAFSDSDQTALERLGRSLGARGLVPFLDSSTDRLTILAAAAAAPYAPDGLFVLDRLRALAAVPDRRIATAASRTAAGIAEAASRDTALRLDLSASEMDDWVASWSALAAADRGWTDVRVHALVTAAALSRAIPSGNGSAGDAPFDLARALADGDPEIRRAALELVRIPLRDAVRPLIGQALDNDSEPAVALAAAQTLCADADAAGSTDSQAPFDRLSTSGRARVHQLVAETATDLLPSTAVALARCLSNARDPKARDSVRALLARLPSAVRATVAPIAPESRRKPRRRRKR